jgi:Domain of unknown function (DUF1707)
MRVSDNDRERVVDALKAAYVYGLVTKDEFDARVSQTFASRTSAELALVTADIPAGLAAAPATLTPPPVKATPPADASLGRGGHAVIVSAVLAVLAFVAAFFAGNPAGGVLALGAAGSGVAGLFLAAAQILSSRRDKRPERPGGQLPPQGAIGTQQGIGQRPPTGQPRRQSSADAARSHSPRLRLST